jgi:hypothetical protein
MMEQELDTAAGRVAVRPLAAPAVIPGIVPIVVLALTLFGVVLLVQLSGVTATGYDLRRLQNERADWARENQTLESYVANLQSLERVERVAVDRLKMIPAKERIFVRTSRQPARATVPAEQPPQVPALATRPEPDDPHLRFARWLASWLAIKPPEHLARPDR